MMKVYLWTLIPWSLTKSDKLLSVVELQKQNLAASGMKDDASIVESRDTWQVTAQRRNTNIQSHTKPSQSLSITDQSTPIVLNIFNRSPIIIEDSKNQISNHLNSAIIPKDASPPSKK